MKKTSRTRWIIELDYDADPDTDGDAVRDSLADQLSSSKGNPMVLGDKVIVDCLDDAFHCRMRFSENIVSITKEDAA